MRPTRRATHITEDIEDSRSTQGLAPGYYPPSSYHDSWWRRQHVLLQLGILAIVGLAIWIVSAHIYVWLVDVVHDPGYYTQTAHRDVLTLPDAQGHQEQVRAFVDSQSHLNLLIIPDGNVSKARIITGPELVNVSDPQQVMIEVSRQGASSILIQAHGPLYIDLIALTPTQQSAQWLIDLSSKGGK
jgi:hypothetical protein